jgi:hypothetical protein
MESPNGSEFTMPQVQLGDMVMYYSSPLDLSDPVIGWVSTRPGSRTLSLLVFGNDGGFIEKASVRHLNDPGLQENSSWRQWGAWVLHPHTEMLRKLDTLMPQLVALLARNQNHHNNKKD